MYQHFFGFKKRPFKLVPEPDCLFLSRSHEEALAHLKYAVMSEEGFVELTGEVGTGKTLLCRVFLENVGPEVETAYIFNPKMDACELLASVNAEFGIASHYDSPAALIDELNRFLIEQKARGKKALLLIDEAQNLSPALLEQIRLLTNLETSREKLLQIVLAGQPELGEVLDSHELRQLAQRITVSCRLFPLSLKETRDYIRHRLHVAACRQVRIFTEPAVRRIFAYSRGVPRLINIACDRSLLAAYSENKQRVSGRIAKTAVRELASRGERRQEGAFPANRRKIAVTGFAAVFLLAGLVLYKADTSRLLSPIVSGQKGPRLEQIGAAAGPPECPGTAAEMEKPAARRPEPDKPENSVAAESAGRTSSGSASAIPQLLHAGSELPSRQTAAASVLSLWGSRAGLPETVPGPADDPAYFELVSRLNGLSLYRIEGDLQLVKRLNLPAILQMEPPDKKGPLYLAVLEAGANSLTLSPGPNRRHLAASYAAVDKYWSGVAFVMWKNFYHYQGTIPLDSPGDSIITLKMHLRDLGFSGLAINAAYNSRTRNAVRAIQARHRLNVDGYVGPLTKIVLYNETPSLEIPRLDRRVAAGGAPDSG
ncbi:MAG TPA: AAA family ATPase [Desulfosalsimonadaceae bacterium]|nr:AAA family ATPase [Desulfosalsimonadaceae bacterium]